MSAAYTFGKPFSAVDTAWLHMDSPTNLAMIAGVITFSEKLDFERLIETMQARLLKFDRFKHRVWEPRFGPPFWVEDPNFDIHNHVMEISLPEPGDHQALQTLVSELMSVPLDRSKPLWEFHYVDNYINGSALIVRLHHSIADGIALIQVLLSTTDTEPDTPLHEPKEEIYYDLSPLARFFVPAIVATRTIQGQIRSMRRLVYKGIETITHPEGRRRLARLGVAGSLALGKLLLMLPDRKTVLRGDCGVPKVAAWSKEIKLADVKVVGQDMGCTVNDVLMAAMTGALRRYLLERGEMVEGLNVRSIVPVNLRPPGEVKHLGNRFGLVFLSLPIGIEDPVERLEVLKKRMDAIKGSPEAVVAFGILNFMGFSPNRIEDLIRMLFGLKGSAVITNVPGPQNTLYLAGGRIDGLMFWVPTPANLALGMSIISYDGDVMVGVETDAGIIPDPEKIVDAFQDEFETLKTWGQSPEQVDFQPEIDEDTLVEEEAEVPVEEPVEEAPAAETEVSEDVSDTATETFPQREGMCQALTKKGLPCKNRALPGTKYCRVHTV